MEDRNPFEGVKTYDSYRHVWELTGFVVLMQVLAVVVTNLAGHLFAVRLDPYEGFAPALLITGWVSWAVLDGLGVSFRGALADWRASFRPDLLKALRYFGGYAALLTCMGLALAAVYYFWGESFVRLMKPIADSGGEQGLAVRTAAGSPARYLLTLFSCCVLAPLAEETLFRRIIFTTIRARKGFWASACWSALLFSLFHGVTAPVIFPVGVYLCWAYERERRLPVNIMLHALMNLSVVLYKTFG